MFAIISFIKKQTKRPLSDLAAGAKRVLLRPSAGADVSLP